ncbi:hypothetical protein D3C80_2053570 [compost metagenome]
MSASVVGVLRARERFEQRFALLVTPGVQAPAGLVVSLAAQVHSVQLAGCIQRWRGQYLGKGLQHRAIQ